jgi:hypothetical protein
LLLLLEALTRSVLPHHVLCSDCSSSSSSKGPSDVAQHLRMLLGDFVGNRNSSMLVKLCVSILQHGSSVPTQQQEQQGQQSQVEEHRQQQPDGTQQQQQKQWQRLLHLWSLTASLLKLPLGPVKGLQLITGCTQVASVGLQAMQLIMQHTAAGAVSLVQHSLLLAPWLALAGRCFLAQVGLLRAVLEMPPPADMSHLADCSAALSSCLMDMKGVKLRWLYSIDSINSDSSSSSIRGLSQGCSTTHGPPIEGSAYLRGLELQLQLDHASAVSAAQGAVAAAAAAAAAGTLDAGYAPLHNHLVGTKWPSRVDLPYLTVDSFDVRTLLTHTWGRIMCLECTGESSSSSVSPSGGSSSSSSSVSPSGGSRSSSSVSPSVDSSAGGSKGGSVPEDTAQEHRTAAFADELKHCRDSDECWRLLSSHPCVGMTLCKLEQLGLELCNQLPMPWLCNNPQCSNLSGVSELQLVGGKACVCGSCGVAR